MKQIIFTAILLLAFCFAAFAQTSDNINTAAQPAMKLVAEFNDSSNEWYKLSMENLGLELGNDPLSTGFIRIRNDKNFSRRLYFVRLGLRFYRMDLSRISLLIVDEQQDDTNILILPHGAEMPKLDNCIVMRTIDIDKIEKLFRPKPITKKRKKH